MDSPRRLFSPDSDGGSLDEEATEADFAAMAEALPHLSAMVAAEVHDNEEDPLGWCDSQNEFEFTLTCFSTDWPARLSVPTPTRVYGGFPDAALAHPRDLRRNHP